jgi:hypothetical protein
MGAPTCVSLAQAAAGATGQAVSLLPPPTALAVTLDDRVFVRTNCTLAGVIIDVGVRFLSVDGNWIPDQIQIPTNPTISPTFDLFPAYLGYLLNIGISVDGSSVAVPAFACYVEVGLWRGNAATGFIEAVLWSGWISSLTSGGWPAASTPPEHTGPGNALVIGPTILIPGSDPIWNFPATAYTELLVVQGQLQTAAVIGNRVVVVQVTLGATRIFSSQSQYNQPTASTVNYTFSQGSGFSLNISPVTLLQIGFVVNSSLGVGLIVPPLSQLTMLGVGGAGDLWVGPLLLARQWQL